MIETDRLRLRQYDESDRTAVVTLFCDVRAMARVGGAMSAAIAHASFDAWLDKTSPIAGSLVTGSLVTGSLAIGSRVIGTRAAQISTRRHRAWCVTDHAGFVGHAALLDPLAPPFDKTDLEISVILHPDAWGHRYGVECCRALVEQARIEGRRAIAIVDADHQAARRMLDAAALTISERGTPNRVIYRVKR